MARYDWTPFFSAINGAIDDYSERQQYAGLLGGGTNGANQAASGLLSGVDPAQLSMLRRLPPKVGMKMLGELIKPDEYSTDPKFNAVDNKSYVFGKRGGMKEVPNYAPRTEIKIGPNGQAYDPYAIKPGQIFNKPGDAFNLGPNGESVPDPVVQDFQIKLNRARAPNTSVTLNAEKGYSGAMATAMATRDNSILEAGRTAPSRIATSQQILNILDTQDPILGAGAEWRLGIDKAFAVAGLTDGKSADSTQSLMKALNQSTLDVVKSSGLGSGNGFTDKDRQFLQDAANGDITWTRETLRRSAHLSEVAGFEAIKQSNRVAGRLKGNPNFGSVAQDLEVQAPKPYGPQRKPPAAAAPVRITSEAEFDSLPPGTVFIDPEGVKRVKP